MILPRRGVSSLGVLLVLAAGCSDASPAAGGPAPSAEGSGRSTGSCASDVTRDALPAWARTGFRGDGSGVPHVFGRKGDIAAVLFDYPPTAFADPGRGDKILWISRLPQQAMHPLKIKAALEGSNTSVVREVPGGPGPSSVNLPTAGCWRLALSWSGHTDTMVLRFGGSGTRRRAVK